jgi:hypothetical protein
MVVRHGEGLVDSGKSISGSTVNRYCVTIGMMYLMPTTQMTDANGCKD